VNKTLSFISSIGEVSRRQTVGNTGESYVSNEAALVVQSYVGDRGGEDYVTFESKNGFIVLKARESIVVFQPGQRVRVTMEPI
jgi:hypothetical protein